MNILVIHGPNLSHLEFRNPDQYGTLSLKDIYQTLTNQFPEIDFTFYQSNHEGEIIDIILHSLTESYQAIVINPGAYTHTSIAIRDALELIKVPKVEVHLSNINEREEFRKINYIKDVCNQSFMGKHIQSYIEAINFLMDKKIV